MNPFSYLIVLAGLLLLTVTAPAPAQTLPKITSIQLPDFTKHPTGKARQLLHYIATNSLERVVLLEENKFYDERVIVRSFLSAIREPEKLTVKPRGPKDTGEDFPHHALKAILQFNDHPPLRFTIKVKYGSLSETGALQNQCYMIFWGVNRLREDIRLTINFPEK